MLHGQRLIQTLSTWKYLFRNQTASGHQNRSGTEFTCMLYMFYVLQEESTCFVCCNSVFVGGRNEEGKKATMGRVKEGEKGVCL